jgi:hypothetical protein
MTSFIHGPNGAAEQQSQNALVAICWRDEYYPVWEAMCRPSWERYCALHGFDLIVMTERLDSSERAVSRSPSWEKLLVLEQPWARDYERIVWLGEEVVISRRAPNILQSVPDPAKIGVCASGGQMSDAEKHIYIERAYNRQFPPENGLLAWRLHGQSVFERLGLPARADMFSRGVFVFSPRHHAAMLRDVYDGNQDSSLHEQPFISAEICTRGLAQMLSARFGWSVHEALELGFAERPSPPVTSKLLEQLVFVIRNELAKAYFLDFAGSRPLMSLLYQAGIPSLEDMPPSPSSQPGSSDGDYISPGLSTVRPDIHFPQMTIGNPQDCPWPYLRRNSPHHWYVDRRWPAIGFVSRDEAHILYNTALQAAGMPALEIGAFMGWSACHLALAGVDLDVIDPLLGDQTAQEWGVFQSAERRRPRQMSSDRRQQPCGSGRACPRTQQTLEPHLHRWRSRRRSAAPGCRNLRRICSRRLHHPVPRSECARSRRRLALSASARLADPHLQHLACYGRGLAGCDETHSACRRSAPWRKLAAAPSRSA